MLDWYGQSIAEPGRSGVFWMLVAFVATFLITRWVTRRIRRAGAGPSTGRSIVRDINVGGVHLHHQVPGILLLLLSALLEFAYQPDTPWVEILGAAFGAGAALTLDEFALWLYLDDVYWTEEGRRSIDAVIVGACVCGLFLIGTAPFGIDDLGDTGETGLGAAAVTLAQNGICASITFLKGKRFVGAAGVLVPIVALVGAIRLAKPGSPWARWRYRSRPARLRRAERRLTRDQARMDRVRDLLGGATET